MEADKFIDFCTSVRPTRNRLLAAMGIATIFIALLLASFGPVFDHTASDSMPDADQSHLITVYIRKGEGEMAANAIPPEQLVAEEPVDLRRSAAAADPPDSPIDLPPSKDWRAISDAASKASADENFWQEESRASMWRRSRSIMFQPGDEFVAEDEQSLLADIRFIRRSHVLGIGINIGSCFIGIPIAGLPVEQRSGAITLFACGQGS